jgi:hypothetical protein
VDWLKELFDSHFEYVKEIEEVDWLKELFDSHFEYVKEIEAIRATLILSVMTLEDHARLLDQEHKRASESRPETPPPRMPVEIFQTAVPLARKQYEEGFPSIFAHATVDLWASLEAFLEDLLVRYLLHDPLARQNPVFEKIKISLVDYESMDAEERMRYLVNELEKEKDGVTRAGIDHFETMLKKIGLDGRVEPEVRQTLIELQQQRNIIIHRRSIVDRRFVRTCPWLGLQVGQKRMVKFDDAWRYFTACRQYMWTVQSRFFARYGIPLPPLEVGERVW